MDNLQQECGVTQVSLDNAKILLAAHGAPTRIDFHADKRHCDYTIIVMWPDGFVFTFSGFAWGYGGTGPAGLHQFFEWASVSSILVDDIPLDKYGKTDCTWFRNVEDVTASI